MTLLLAAQIWGVLLCAFAGVVVLAISAAGWGEEKRHSYGGLQ